MFQNRQTFAKYLIEVFKLSNIYFLFLFQILLILIPNTHPTLFIFKVFNSKQKQSFVGYLVFPSTYLVRSQELWVEADEVHTPGSLALQAGGSCTWGRRGRGRGRV